MIKLLEKMKKRYWHSTFGEIQVKEQVYRMRQRGDRFRSFSESIGVSPRSYSRCLQRVICDFGADHTLGTLNKKLTEHDVQEITNLGEALGLPVNSPADFVICKTDGSMIPMVETYLSETAAPSDK